MSGWRKTTIEELAAPMKAALATGPFGSAVSSKNFRTSGIPMLRGSNLSEDVGIRLSENDVVFLDPELAATFSRSTAVTGDLIFTCWGSIGQIGLIESTSKYGQYVVSNKQMKLTPDPAQVDSRFLYYNLSQPSMIFQVQSRAIGSTIPGFNLGQLRSLEVEIPSLVDQQAIAEVLGALDDKIAANTKLAATVEALMLASFKKLLLTSEVREVNVQDLVSRLQITRKFSKSEILELGEFPVYDQSEYGHLGYLNGGTYLDASAEAPILYFGDHTCKLRLSTEKFYVGPNTIPFVSNDIPTLTLFAALQGAQVHEEYKRHWGNLMSKSILIPSQASCSSFQRRFTSTLPLITELHSENKTIAATRDALLPQLMSGKLRVKDAERAVSAAV